jgi:hypothetical protein
MMIFRALTRWQRARTVALTLIIGAGLFTLRAPLAAVLTSLLPSVPPHVAVDSAPDERECQYGRPEPVFARRFERPILEPRIESRDGVWIGRDLLGTSSIEIVVDEGPEPAEAEAIAWVRSICDTRPRELHLVGFHDKSIRDALERRIEHACPNLDVCTFGGF